MTSTATLDHGQIEEALAQGLITAETARRVGWAKAYEALARIDSLEEGLRQTRDELISLRRAYSRLLGFVNTIPLARTPLLDAELRAHCTAERAFRHEDAWDKGVALGNEHRARLNNWTIEQIELDRLARRWAAKYTRTKTRELFAAGEAAGHFLQHGDHSATCSCGEVFPLVTDASDRYGSAHKEHLAQVVHGKSFRALKHRWKSERPEADPDLRPVGDQS